MRLKKKVLNIRKEKQESPHQFSNFQERLHPKRKLDDSSEDSEFIPSPKKLRRNNLPNLSEGMVRLRKPRLLSVKEEERIKENSLEQKDLQFSQFGINPQNLILDSKECRTIDCGAEGDCLFKSVCFLIGRPESDHRKLRREAVKYIKEHKESFIEFFTQEEDFEDYVSKMNQGGTWGGDYEIQALSCVLERHILVFEPMYNQNDEIMLYQLRNQYGKNSYDQDEALYLLYIPQELHYQALEFKSTQEEEAEILKSDDNEDQYILFNPESDRYNEISQYLQNSRLPDRFSEYDSRKFITKKRKWINKFVGKYFIDENSGRLIHKRHVKYSFLPKHQEKPDWDPYIKLYEGRFEIPFEKEVPSILQEAHKFHENKDKMSREISRMGYYWDQAKKYCADFISNCSICCERRRQQLSKKKEYDSGIFS